MGTFSLYLHIPFCAFRCAYCDFNTYAGLDDLIAPYARALAAEVWQVGRAGGRPTAHTVFFGGGTPSLLPLALLRDIFSALRDSFSLTPDCEITLEANPGTVSRAHLAGLRELGINRLSFGVQSSHPHELRLLDRQHLFGDAAQAVTWARAAGFDNLNLDLIFGLPHQTLAQWQATLRRTLTLGPEHLSAYALSLEHGTPMRAWVQRGLLPAPDPDLAAEMYEWASDELEANGLEQYEISNWAKKDSRFKTQIPNPKSQNPNSKMCQHNLQYWRNEPYLGLGAGAHGYAGGWRYSNVLSPAAYIERLANSAVQPFPFSSATQEKIVVTTDAAMGETMMMGLRLTREGVTDERFRGRFGLGLADKYSAELQQLRQKKLLEWDGARARLTRAGRLLGNVVFREFV